MTLHGHAILKISAPGEFLGQSEVVEEQLQMEYRFIRLY